MTSKQTPRENEPHRSGADHQDQQDLNQDRRELRQLIDRFCDRPQTDDDNGFYRNVGHYIARSVTRPRWPGDTGY